MLPLNFRMVAVLLWIAAVWLIWLQPESAALALPSLLLCSVLPFWLPSFFFFAFPIFQSIAGGYVLTGNLVLQPSDAILLGGAASTLWNASYRTVPSASGYRWNGLATGLFLLSAGIACAIGFRALPSSDWGDQLSVYFSCWNAVRIGQGYLWAAGFVLMVHFARVEPRRIMLAFGKGMQSALLLVGAIVLLERFLFEGVFDFSSELRATGPFASMHIGGQHLDAFLTMAIPFAFLATRPNGMRFGLITLICLGLYASLATMSRATLVAVFSEVVVLSLVTTLPSSTNGSFGSTGFKRMAASVFILAIAVAAVIGAWKAEAIRNRFQSVAADWQTRLDHWQAAITESSQSSSELWLGQGMGTFPVREAKRQHRAMPPLTWSSSESGFITIRSGWPIYLQQWIEAPAPGEVSIRVRARSRSEDATLSTSICRQALLKSYDCSGGSVLIPKSEDGEWVWYSIPLKPQGAPRIHAMDLRPVSFNLFHSGGLGTIELDRVSILVDGKETSVLRNDDFATGTQRWFFSCDDHLIWHSKNVLIHLLVEHGLIGVGLFVLVVFTRLFKWRSSGYSIVLTSIVGTLFVAIFDSLLDVPGLTALFFAILFLPREMVVDRSAINTFDRGAINDQKTTNAKFQTLLVILASLSLSGCKPEAPKDPPPAATPTPSKAQEAAEPPKLQSTKPAIVTPTPTPKKKSYLRFLRAPRLTDVPVPDFPGAHAIWGSTGRDQVGRIYFGVAAYGVDDPSARLFRFDPKTSAIADLGRVNSKLGELKVRRMTPFPETQMKIHSRIVQASDGRMYFSSQDEHDEAGDGSQNALFGGRLFALDPTSDQWECVLTAPEGLIAVACHQRYVYTLGYFGHVVYQYDTQTKTIRSKKLGTFGGHASRNLFVDSREHVYAVRLAEYDGSETSGVTELKGRRVRATLVELDRELNELAETPLDDYQPTADTDSHGITAFSHLTNGEIIFVTHSGALWRIGAGEGSKPAKLERLGWFHPKGSCYVATLFAPTGYGFVGGFAKQGNGPYEWVVHEFGLKQSTALSLNRTSTRLLEQPGLLLYGSETMDDEDRAYVVGWREIDRGFGPHVLRLEWPEYLY